MWCTWVLCTAFTESYLLWFKCIHIAAVHIWFVCLHLLILERVMLNSAWPKVRGPKRRHRLNFSTKLRHRNPHPSPQALQVCRLWRFLLVFFCSLNLCFSPGHRCLQAHSLCFTQALDRPSTIALWTGELTLGFYSLIQELSALAWNATKPNLEIVHEHLLEPKWALWLSLSLFASLNPNSLLRYSWLFSAAPSASWLCTSFHISCSVQIFKFF